MPVSKKLKLVGCDTVGSPPKIFSGEAVTIRFQIHEFGHREEKINEYLYTGSVVALGHPWKLRIYPRGNEDFSADVDHVAIYLFYSTGSKNNSQSVLAEATIRTKTIKKILGYATYDDKRGYGWSNFSKRDNILSDDCDGNGTLTIDVDIKVATETKPTWYPKLETCNDFCTKLYHSTETTDVLFIVGSGSKQFKAHKCVLALEARALYELVLMESKDSRERNEDLINIVLPNINESSFESMLQFIYTRKKPMIEDNENDAKNLLLVTDHFNYLGLKLYTESVITDKILDSTNAARLLLLADSLNCALLKEACMNKYVANPNAVMESLDDWTKLEESNKLLKELLIYTINGHKSLKATYLLLKAIN
mmetsp:Transcript_36492/g.40298  ORF Transcript_36492/g.40298 Transcript_36492/m.40298 type:complete len:366 (+) Transcript_36492:359-1456(+)